MGDINVFIEELNICQNILQQELGQLVPTPYLVLLPPHQGLPKYSK
jgi:hypothetical protein